MARNNLGNLAKQAGRFEEAESWYERAIEADGPLLVGVDFGPQTMAELEPVLLAVLHRIFQAGIDPDQLTVIRLREHSIGPPEDGIYALGATCDDRPALCRSFVDATLEGWRQAAVTRKRSQCHRRRRPMWARSTCWW